MQPQESDVPVFVTKCGKAKPIKNFFKVGGDQKHVSAKDEPKKSESPKKEEVKKEEGARQSPVKMEIED